MENTIRVFVPMPGGKPDESVWPELVQEGTATARSIAAANGVELVAPWHQSSEWTEQAIGGDDLGDAVAGWMFTYETR